MIGMLLRSARRLRAQTSFRITLGGAEFAARQGQTVLEAAQAAGINLPYSCQVGACGECICRVMQGHFRILKPLDHILAQNDLDMGFTLACQAVPESDLVLAAQRPNRRWSSGRIESISQIDHDVVKVALRLDQPVRFACGQFIDLQVPELPAATRSYSMVNVPEPGGNRLLQFHIKLRAGGQLSAWWCQRARAGSKVFVGAPKGKFAVPRATSPPLIVGVAGGSGMGVVAALVREQAQGAGLRACVIVAISRSGRSSYHRAVLEELQSDAGIVPEVVDIPYAAWCGGGPVDLGRLEAAVAQEGPQAVRALVCGSPPVVHWGTVHLSRLGLRHDHIATDVFVPPKRETDRQCSS